MKTILFQGDSITDAERPRDDSRLGFGYALLATAELSFENPGEYNFINRGISGNTVVDIYTRIKRDIINLKPDYMSILAGVNGVCHDITRNDGVDSEKFYKIYSMLLEEVRTALPDTKIIILSPFIGKGILTEENYSLFESEVIKRVEKTELIAKKYNLNFVNLFEKFNDAFKIAPDSVWLRDGIHPTPAGHELIAREWLKAFNTIK